MPPFKLAKSEKPMGGFSEYSALKRLTASFERPLEAPGSRAISIDPLDGYVLAGKAAPVAAILPVPRSSDTPAPGSVSALWKSLGSALRNFFADLAEWWANRPVGPVLMAFIVQKDFHKGLADPKRPGAEELRTFYDDLMAKAGTRVMVHQKIREVVVADAAFKDPMAIWDPLARSFGLDTMAYMGVLLKNAEALEVNAWLESRRPKNNNPRDQAAFKIRAMDWIEAYGIEQCIPRLKDYLRDRSEEVRLRAAQVLLAFKETEGVALVLTGLVLKSDDPEIALKALEALRLIDEKKTAVVFAEAGMSEDSNVRVAAFETLQEWGRLDSKSEQLQELFQVYEQRVQMERRMDYLLEHVSEGLRLAIILQKLGKPVDVSPLFDAFLSRYRPKSKVVDSELLEKTLELYAVAGGQKAKSTLFRLVLDRSALPAVRSGAIRALGRDFVPPFVAEGLLRILSDSHLEDGVRISALEVLLKKNGISNELLKPWAIELAQSPHLFVKMRAIEALIELKEQNKAKILLKALQSIPWDTWVKQATQAVERGDPFARHEETAFDQVEAWKLLMMDLLVPGWREPLQVVDYTDIIKMVEEQIYQREQFKLPEELDPLVKRDFNWLSFYSGEKGSPFSMQVELAKAVLDFSQESRVSEGGRKRIFKSASKKAVMAIAAAAASNLSAVDALVVLHRSDNPYAKSALLSLNIRPFLRRIEEDSDTHALIVVHRLAAADIGHAQAKLVVPHLPENPEKRGN